MLLEKCLTPSSEHNYIFLQHASKV